ncbi:MAG: hypothetical protein PHO02_03575 [Candidatus Nanoarchaeia archaeon]|nr:hypothetical protein [Candidatus Nanoarchaeia archaeon]
MNGSMKVLKVAAGFSGSVLMLLGIVLLFITLITAGMVANVDTIDQTIASTMQKFVQENREDIREFTLDEMEKQGAELTKEQVKALCVSPNMLDMIGDSGAAFKSALTQDVCGNIDTAPFEETQAKLIDNIVENNIDSILNLPQTQELKESIRNYGAETAGSSIYFLIASAVLFALGIFFTFAGVSFNWKRGLYKVCIKTGIRLGTIALLLLILSLVSADSVVDTMKALESQAPQMMVNNAPPVLLKLIATIVLDWVKSATNPFILISFLSALPFIAAAVAMKLTILKRVENGDPADKKVV